VISRPALEQARSADAEVAGIARIAILAKTGYLLWFVCGRTVVLRLSTREEREKKRQVMGLNTRHQSQTQSQLIEIHY